MNYLLRLLEQNRHQRARERSRPIWQALANHTPDISPAGALRWVVFAVGFTALLAAGSIVGVYAGDDISFPHSSASHAAEK